MSKIKDYMETNNISYNDLIDEGADLDEAAYYASIKDIVDLMRIYGQASVIRDIGARFNETVVPFWEH